MSAVDEIAFVSLGTDRLREHQAGLAAILTNHRDLHKGLGRPKPGTKVTLTPGTNMALRMPND